MLTATVNRAMKQCGRKGERKACDDCPLVMYCEPQPAPVRVEAYCVSFNGPHDRIKVWIVGWDRDESIRRATGYVKLALSDFHWFNGARKVTTVQPGKLGIWWAYAPLLDRD